MHKTWDGQPVASEPPYGASIVVYRWQRDGCQLLVLHRAKRPVTTGADWEWTPPGGARLPDEPIKVCVRRELYEETGLALQPRTTRHGTPEWMVYAVEVTDDAVVQLDQEHDAFAWLPAAEAAARCHPPFVGEYMLRVAADVDCLSSQRAV